MAVMKGDARSLDPKTLNLNPKLYIIGLVRGILGYLTMAHMPVHRCRPG